MHNVYIPTHLYGSVFDLPVCQRFYFYIFFFLLRGELRGLNLHRVCSALSSVELDVKENDEQSSITCARLLPVTYFALSTSLELQSNVGSEVTSLSSLPSVFGVTQSVLVMCLPRIFTALCLSAVLVLFTLSWLLCKTNSQTPYDAVRKIFSVCVCIIYDLLFSETRSERLRSRE